MEGLHLYRNQLRTNSHVCMYAHLCVYVHESYTWAHGTCTYTVMCMLCVSAENCLCGPFLCVSHTQVCCVCTCCVC